jgi:hypothetical protein
MLQPETVFSRQQSEFSISRIHSSGWLQAKILSLVHYCSRDVTTKFVLLVITTLLTALWHYIITTLLTALWHYIQLYTLLPGKYSFRSKDNILAWSQPDECILEMLNLTSAFLLKLDIYDVMSANCISTLLTKTSIFISNLV